jgi:hypothetical protein
MSFFATLLEWELLGLGIPDYATIVTWGIATFAAIRFRLLFEKSSKGWTLIAAGAGLTLLRSIVPLLSFLPDVKLVKYLVGLAGAVLLIWGFYTMYKEVKQ